MIFRPPGFRGAAFTTAAEGDQRNDLRARAWASVRLGISSEWATVRQVHGAEVLEAQAPGVVGEADGLFTTVSGLPLAVFTADCAGVVLEGDHGVGVAHAGWRGMAAGTVPALRAAMEEAGIGVERAAFGPLIGPCCFEVGAEVVTALPASVARTSWGTPSVDLRSELRRALAGLDCWEVTACTHHDPDFFSHRRTGTPSRMVALGWLT